MQKKGEEFSDNDNVDYFDEYEHIHGSLYQNVFLQHCFNGSLSTDDVDDNHPNVNIFNKSFDQERNTNTSSSQSSSSNQSERINALPHYQPRWHQQLTAPLMLRNPLHPSIIKAHLDSVNQEIAQLDSRIENVLMKQHHAAQAIAEVERNSAIYRAPIDATNDENIRSDSNSVINNSTAVIPVDNKFKQMNIGKRDKSIKMNSMKDPPSIDSDTEHIYETIPEDSETEPIYCSPYKDDSESDQNIVEEWLNINQNRTNSDTINRSTKSSTSNEDHENSSSAYNTGGSCNSHHQLTLDLNDSTSTKDGSKTLVFCPTKHLQPKFPHKEQAKVENQTKKDKNSPIHQQKQNNELESHQLKEKRSSLQGNFVENIFKFNQLYALLTTFVYSQKQIPYVIVQAHQFYYLQVIQCTQIWQICSRQCFCSRNYFFKHFVKITRYNSHQILE